MPLVAVCRIRPHPISHQTLFTRERINTWGLCLALAGALAIFAGVANFHYPIGEWLAWRYLRASALAVAWALSCLSCGYFLLDRLGATFGSADSESAIAFPLGVLAFQLSMFLLGLAGLLGTATFFGLPLLFAFAGRRRLVASIGALRALKPPTDFLHFAIAMFGLGGAALLYFMILSPQTFHWDTRWYHLPLAQQYALSGAVRPFPEGWWLDGQPHSASLLYAWGLSLPQTVLFDRLELCIHMEFVVFLATVASIPTLVRHLAPNISVRGTWSAIFLFPGIFLYDSNLCAAADHIAALWCIPIALTLINVWAHFTVRNAFLFGAFMGAGVASKYSAWSMLFFPGVLFVVRGGWLVVSRAARGVRRDARSTMPALVAGIATMLLISGQHWLKNWIWYGDPVYPLLNGHLHSHPWSAEAAASFRVMSTFTFPPRAGLLGVWDALKATLTFSFLPNDWPVLHRNVPVFGSLFTLSMMCLPFVRAGKRLWFAYAAVMVAIVVWYLTSHQDRYIQAWMPCIVACTAATLGLAWSHRHRLVRGLVAALVGLQIIWGGDVPFFPTHNLINDSPIRLVSNFIASGFLKTPDRFRLFGDEGLVARRLPDNAILLLHEINLQIGFDARTVSDQWQGRLSYATLASPAAIYKELADMKITHVVWNTGGMSSWNSVGSALAFLGFALNHTSDREVVGQFTLARFPTSPPAAAFNDRVVLMTCGYPYAPGRYHVDKLVVPDPGKPFAAPEAPVGDVAAAVRDAGFLVVEPACAGPLPADVGSLFHPPVARDALQLYVRRR